MAAAYQTLERSALRTRTENALPEETRRTGISGAVQLTAADYSALENQARERTASGQLKDVDPRPQKAALAAWRTAAQQQAAGQIDHAALQGIRDLADAQADAEKRYRDQLNAITVDEVRARDNQALYSAARGDLGGIGAAQYDAVSNTAAVNRQNVYTARTQLASDTARQIANLRAQGEYAKADKALEIAQSYLTQLRSIEQWAAEANMTTAQVNASMDRWLSEYLLDLNKAGVSAGQQAEQMAFQREQFAWNQQKDQRDYERSVLESDRGYGLQREQLDWNRQKDQRDYNRSVLESDRNYNRSVLEDDRNYAYKMLTRDDNLRQQAVDNANRARQLDLSAKQLAESLKLDWAKLGLDKEKFVETVKQWWTNFDAEQSQQSWENAYSQRSQQNSRQKQLSSDGMDLLVKGLMPSDEQLRAMGLTRTEAARYAAKVNQAAG